MILVKTLIFLLVIIIICHVYKKLSDRNEKREGYTQKKGGKKVPTKKETDEVAQKAQKALVSLQIPKQHQDMIVNKIKEFNIDEKDMTQLQGKLQELLTLSESSKKINEGLTQNK